MSRCVTKPSASSICSGTPSGFEPLPSRPDLCLPSRVFQCHQERCEWLGQARGCPVQCRALYCVWPAEAGRDDRKASGRLDLQPDTRGSSPNMTTNPPLAGVERQYQVTERLAQRPLRIRQHDGVRWCEGGVCDSWYKRSAYLKNEKEPSPELPQCASSSRCREAPFRIRNSVRPVRSSRRFKFESYLVFTQYAG
jgi:hypothetical protein